MLLKKSFLMTVLGGDKMREQNARGRTSRILYILLKLLKSAIEVKLQR